MSNPWVKLLRRGERHCLKWTWVHSLTPTDHYIQDDPRTVQDPLSTLGACVNCINPHMKFTSYTTPNYVNLILLQPSYVFTECSRVFLGKRKVEVAWRCWDIAHKQSYLSAPAITQGKGLLLDIPKNLLCPSVGTGCLWGFPRHNPSEKTSP